jgi:heme/copper-type cytochrome/quinol oxidase subunit 4
MKREMESQRKKGQAVLEYFLAFALIIIFTVIGFNRFLEGIKTSGEEFFKEKIEIMGIKGE